MLRIAAALVAFIITAAYKDSILKDDPLTLDSVDFMWRLLIGLGAVPGCIALYFRLTIPETPRFTMDIERNIDQASHDIKNVLSGGERAEEDEFVQRIDAPKASWGDFCAYFGQLHNFKILLGTAYSWFALDVSLLRFHPPRVSQLTYLPADCFLWPRIKFLDRLASHQLRYTRHQRHSGRL